MLQGADGWLMAVVTSAVDVVAAQSLDPTVVIDGPGVYRAGASFVLVLLSGTFLLVQYEQFVNESVDSLTEDPHVSVVYGLIAYGIVVFLGAVGLMQLAQFGITAPAISYAALAVVSVAVLLLAGLGYAVVGAWLTELNGTRQTWTGLVFGAALSAVGWFVLPVLVGALVWVAVPAFGIGGPVREWMHAERTVESEMAR